MLIKFNFLDNVKSNIKKWLTTKKSVLYILVLFFSKAFYK